MLLLGAHETELPSAAIPGQKQLMTAAMRRTSEWISSQETPTYVAVQVGDASFSLPKSPLVSKCGYIQKLFTELKDGAVVQIPDIPGGAEAFELVTKFCYGLSFEITMENVALLRCAAEYLEMTEELETGNLISLTEDYLEEVALVNLSGAITVLHKSEDLLPMAEKVKLVSRCIDAVAYLACNDSQLNLSSRVENFRESFGSFSQPKAVVAWWAEELIVLRINMFHRVLMAIKARGFEQYALGPVIMLYAQKSLRGLDIFGRRRKIIDPKEEYEKRVVLETVVSLLPVGKNTMSVSFLSVLLRAAIYLETTVACRLDLEKRIGLQLGQAVLDDLLIPTYAISDNTIFDVDTIKRILVNYLEHEGDDSRFGDNGEDGFMSPPPSDMEQVGKLMEGYLAEIASDRNLTIEKFHGLAELIPEQARVNEDGMYRAIDIYLKAHPSLNDIERKKICSLLDCQKLSREACAHAAQNNRLPVQIVVRVLHYEQQRLRDGMTVGGGYTGAESPAMSFKSSSYVGGYHHPPEELSHLRRENDNLKLELMRMQMQLKGGNQRRPAGQIAAADKASSSPKKSLISSLSKRLLSPFMRSDGVKTPSKGRTKPPKDRRHSIS